MDAALLDHGNAVGQAQRLALIVGHEDRGHGKLAHDLLELDLHGTAQISVERGEGLVEEQHPRADHEGAGKRHPLLLPAGELARPAVLQPFELDEGKRFRDAMCDLRTGDAAHLEAVGDVRRDGHMRKQRVALRSRADKWEHP
jgi:hypothetical protein